MNSPNVDCGLGRDLDVVRSPRGELLVHGGRVVLPLLHFHDLLLQSSVLLLKGKNTLRSFSQIS